ncbi:MAG: MgtC/SapB family protein [Bacteroidia bacterium]|nr:MgtC/SapB family protein [Bacteroidia bacterium]MCZ2249132.1 MgtC/SapB family protein [Bacteroidia bacterium]
MLESNEIILRLLLASLFGGLIGLERERKHWAAGLRTHMMVCVGSCLVMIVSAFGFADILGTDAVSLDPSRVAAQVISGIGFIGAGTILFSKQGTVHGLTTASGLWTVAAIGLATGSGLYFAAGTTTIIALIILWALQPLEQFFTKKFRLKTIKIVTDISINDPDFLRNMLNNEFELKIDSFKLNKTDTTCVFLLKIDNVNNVSAIINRLKDQPFVKEIEWTE